MNPPSLPQSLYAQTPLFDGDDVVDLHVGERSFKTTTNTLIKGSVWWANAIYGGRKYRPNAPYVVDRDPDLFEHILRFLRTGVYPLFYDAKNGHNLVLYRDLLHEAEFYQIETLRKWLSEKKYLHAVKVSYSMEEVEVDSKGPIRRQVSSDANVQHLMSWETKKTYLCPRAIESHHGHVELCGRKCRNKGACEKDHLDGVQVPKVLEIRKHVEIVDTRDAEPTPRMPERRLDPEPRVRLPDQPPVSPDRWWMSSEKRDLDNQFQKAEQTRKSEQIRRTAEAIGISRRIGLDGLFGSAGLSTRPPPTFPATEAHITGGSGLEANDDSEICLGDNKGDSGATNPKNNARIEAMKLGMFDHWQSLGERRRLDNLKRDSAVTTPKRSSGMRSDLRIALAEHKATGRMNDLEFFREGPSPDDPFKDYCDVTKPTQIPNIEYNQNSLCYDWDTIDKLDAEDPAEEPEFLKADILAESGYRAD